MLTATLLLLGLVLTSMALGQRLVRRLPLSPALVYLTIGALAGALEPGLLRVDPIAQAETVTVVSEAAVLLSLFAIGLRVRMPHPRGAWRGAMTLATSGMLVTIALTTGLGMLLLGMDAAAALLLAAILAPTDPVLASDVQVHDEHDGDAVRLSLTVEGALNDATALPVVMLALGALGLHQLHAAAWLWHDLLWPMGGGALIGWTLGRGGGAVLRRLGSRGHGLGWDELLFVGGLLLTFGVARALALSTFLTVFMAGAALLTPDPAASSDEEASLARRLHAFGARSERLVEVTVVLCLGAMLPRVDWSVPTLVFALLLVLLVRPLAVFAVIRRSRMSATRRRLVAWFGIRGVGSVFYLAFALEHGVPEPLAQLLVAACVIAVAASIVAHGISATPLMSWYLQRRG